MRELRRMFAEHRLSQEGDNQMTSLLKPLIKQSFSIKETMCTIITDKPHAAKIAKKTIIHNRKQLENYIRAHPKFLYSLKPFEVNDGPDIVKLMATASAKADVGPMASVAGALADLAVDAMLNCGAKIAIVENGGEVSAVSERPVDVALLAGDSSLSGSIGFRVENFPVGIATSSGLYGHALSFGEAEAVTVFSKNASLADAAATAVCNVVKGEDADTAIKRGIEKAQLIGEVEGVLIIHKGKVALAGKVPKIINLLNGRSKPSTKIRGLL